MHLAYAKQQSYFAKVGIKFNIKYKDACHA